MIVNFNTPTLRLTAGYTAIIMCISLFFSITLDRVMSQQVDIGLHRQASIFLQQRFPPSPGSIDPYDDIFLQAQIHEITTRTRDTLIFLNIGILIIAGSVSYLLARRTLRPMEANLEAQRRFTADASHELRTPLTAMRTEIEVALRTATAEAGEERRIMKSTLEEISRLEQLSKGLLRLARYEERDQPLPKVSLAVTDIIAEAVQKVSHQAKAGGVAVDQKISAGSVTGEHDSIVELLVILLDNAIKYSPAKTTVTISSESDHRRTIIRVADHGIGIPADDLPRIFDRFYRADTSRSKEGVDGYGLGLPIAKQIVERHHGHIHVSSQVGKGTTVTLSLPKGS